MRDGAAGPVLLFASTRERKKLSGVLSRIDGAGGREHSTERPGYPCYTKAHSPTHSRHRGCRATATASTAMPAAASVTALAGVMVVVCERRRDCQQSADGSGDQLIGHDDDPAARIPPRRCVSIMALKAILSGSLMVSPSAPV